MKRAALACLLRSIRLMRNSNTNDTDQPGLQRDPSEWKTGDEPMTAAQRSYLETLCRETGEQFDETLSKADASKRIDELRKIPVERFLIAALDQNLVAIAKHQRAKSVPLGLENPFSARRQVTHPLGEHGQDRWVYREIHWGQSAGRGTACRAPTSVED